MTPCGVRSQTKPAITLQRTMWATNDIGFTRRPSRRNPLPMVHVKVLPCGTTTTDALSSGTRLKPVNLVKPLYSKAKALGFTGYLHKVSTAARSSVAGCNCDTSSG
jgi:hypothetical protein